MWTVSLSTSHLRLLYRFWYQTLPWPAAIPAPHEVTFRWKARASNILGSCHPTAKRIDVSPVFKDRRLLRFLKPIMAHEMAHFIWLGHTREFRDFLRSGGIADDFARATIPAIVSEPIRALSTSAAPCEQDPIPVYAPAVGG